MLQIRSETWRHAVVLGLALAMALSLSASTAASNSACNPSAGDPCSQSEHYAVTDALPGAVYPEGGLTSSPQYRIIGARTAIMGPLTRYDLKVFLPVALMGYRPSWADASSALHVLPPLGQGDGGLSTFDDSLLRYLRVEVCHLTTFWPWRDCETVAVFTEAIQLVDQTYHVDWQIAAADIGETFEAHFDVAGLPLGFVSYIPDAEGTVSIRFRVDNHPRIRARTLHEKGRTATYVAEALVAEFGCYASETAAILAEEGYGGSEVGVVLRDLFDLEAMPAARMMKDAGFSAVDVGWALKDAFGKDIDEVAVILYELGYPIEEVMLALSEVFGADVYMLGLTLRFVFELDASDAARALRDAGYQVRQAYEVLVNIYRVEDWKSARQMLLDAGYTFEEITEEAMAPDLAARFAPVLKFDQNASTFPMDAQKWFEDMLCGDAGGPPLSGGGYDYESCRRHGDEWGTENINDLWNGNPEISTLSEYSNAVPTYYRVDSCGTGGQVRIEYWWFYGWQPKCDCCSGDHRADWEHIMVITSEDWTDVAAVTYSQHEGWYTRIHGGEGPHFGLEGTHPVVYVGKKSHGSYHDDGGTGTCVYYEDWRNPSATSIWRSWQTPLIDLKGSGQDWLIYDRTADWKWGYDEVDTHPARNKDLCQVRACKGKGEPFIYGCWFGKSDCKIGDCWCGDSRCSYSCGACVAWEEYQKDYWLSTSDRELMW